MAETDAKNLEKLRLRADIPRYLRYAATGLLALSVIGVVVGFLYFGREPEFRMKGFPTSLSKDVVASVSGYERREITDNVLQYYIKADKAETFSDNHQELENVYLEVYRRDGSEGGADRITAEKAVYIPEDDKSFRAYFAGDVKIETADELTVKTDQLTYTRRNETAVADEEVEFARYNVSGTSYGATFNSADRTVELLRDVAIESKGDPSGSPGGISNAVINAAYAKYDNAAETIDLTGDFNADVLSGTRRTKAASTRAKVFLTAAEGTNDRDVSKLELFENVAVEVTENGGAPTKITSGYASYDKPADMFDLRGNAKIETVENARSTTITASAAKYQKTKGIVDLTGDSQIVQGTNFVRGDAINAKLDAASNVRSAVVTGNGYLKQTTDTRTTEVNSPRITAEFDTDQYLTSAAAQGSSTVTMTPATQSEYSKMTMAAPNAIRLTFRGKGVVATLRTDGRTTLTFDAPPNNPNGSSKTVVADTVHSYFTDDGNGLRRVEAIGNAEMVATPVRASASSFVTKVNAPRFDCEFYPGGSNVQSCVGSTGTRTVRTPSAPGKAPQTLTADTVKALFDQSSGDVSRYEANGDAKFVQGERNAVSDTMIFTASDEIVRLRGGEPTAWDSKARIKALEIDWDTKNERSAMRGSVSSTYYTQKASGGAAPFAKSGKPVFLTSDTAEFDHRTEVAVYRGSARGWQDNNYVRGDEFVIDQKKGTFRSTGNAESLLYDAKKTINGRETKVPVYATARQLIYDRDRSMIHYQDNVDIRQGTDRIVAGSADVYLDQNNEVTRSVADGNVIMTQPNRKATGDHVDYDAVAEVAVLKGDPATVQDSESGSSSGGEITVYMKENRVVGSNPARRTSPGRTRSVYKVN